MLRRCVRDQYEGPSDASVAFGREWGMRVAVEDLHRVIREARERGGRVDRLRVVNRSDGYTHIDPITAYPDSDFVSSLQRFLGRIAKR